MVAVAVAAFALLTGRNDGRNGRLAAPDPMNATYAFGPSATVALVDGQALIEGGEGASGTVTIRYFGNEASGDLNADAIGDRAFLLTADMGGSGTFYFVAALVSTPSGWAGTDTAFLGDRIAPQSTEIAADGTIVVNYAVRKAGEPFTERPSVGVTKRFRVEGRSLVEL